jgi:hypothetical protein
MTTSAPPFDVYLSYTREDTELVVELQRRIEGMGQRVWRDQTQLTPGGDWHAELTEAIATARMVLFCLGATGLGEGQRDELTLADARARRDPDFLFTAALLPSAPADFPATALPFSLRTRQWLDLRSGVDAVDRLLEFLLPAGRSDPRAGRLAVTPSVESAAARLDGEVTATALVAELLALHPEYGEGHGGGIELDRERGRRAAAGAWLEDVAGLISPGADTQLHGRLVIVGLARIDKELRDQLTPDGFLAEVEREMREPLGSLFAAAPPTPEETVPTHTDNPALRDELNREGVARILARRLRDTYASDQMLADGAPDGQSGSGRSFLVHVQGPWGVGKTSLLNFLRDELHRAGPGERPWIVITFNAWQHQRLAPPWWWLMTVVYAQGFRELWRFSPSRAIWFRAREWLWRLKGGWPGLVAMVAAVAVLVLVWRAGYFRTIAQGDTTSAATLKALVAGVAALLTPLVAIWGVARSAGRWLLTTSARGARVYMEHARDPLQTMKDHFGQLVRWLRPYPLAIIIDDLDRCKPAFAVECLEGIQTLFRDVPAAYVVAADREWLAGSYASDYAALAGAFDEPGRPLGYLFLEKTFQLTVQIPAMSAETRDAYWRRLIRPAADVADPGALEAARKAAGAVFAGFQTEEEVRDELARDPGATPAEQRARLEAAAIQLASPKLEHAAEHVLHPFRPLLDPNPRAMKRLVNAYGLARGIELLNRRTLGGDKPAQQRMALWTILNLRWPRLAEYLAAHPQAAASFDSPADAPKGLASDLLPLLSDPEVIAVVRGEATDVDATLTAETIRLCVSA